MTTHPALHCPKCAGLMQRRTRDNGDVILACITAGCEGYESEPLFHTIPLREKRP